ncbi:MAG TPA: hypothetical protein VFA07_04920 [Chthonomonadaceae bacterium]|nr:hypothetical protein [Chthonomonadaceae bacterium]
MRTRRLMEWILILGALALLGGGAHAQTGPYMLSNSPVALLDNGLFPFGILPLGQGALYNAYLNGVPGSGNGAYGNQSRNFYNVSFGPRDIPRTSDTIEARLESNGKVWIGWQGEPRAVKQITFALLDKNRKPIKQETISRPPAEASLPATKQTAYYGVIVEYINGTTTSVISPLLIPEKSTTDAAPAGTETAAPDSKTSGEKQDATEEDKQTSDPPAQATEPKR